MPHRLALLVLSSVAHANVGWPEAWVVLSASSAPDYFPYLVLLSLVIEFFVLHYFGDIPVRVAALASITLKLVTAAVSFGITFALLPGDRFARSLADRWDPTSLTEGKFLVFFLTAMLLTIALEAVLLHRLWKISWQQSLRSVTPANLTSYALGWIFMFRMLAQ